MYITQKFTQKLHDIGIDNDFLDGTSKAQATTEKIEKVVQLHQS